MSKQYDLSDDSVVVVIGSGAGGGTVANELAQQGIDVVCLEAGSRLTLSDVVNDIRVMDQRMGWHDERRGVPVWLCKTVGGTTMRWSGVTPRFLAHEFHARTTYGAMDDTSLIDWPLTLDELEPWYDKAETKMGVAGPFECVCEQLTNVRAMPSRLRIFSRTSANHGLIMSRHMMATVLSPSSSTSTLARSGSFTDGLPRSSGTVISRLLAPAFRARASSGHRTVMPIARIRARYAFGFPKSSGPTTPLLLAPATMFDLPSNGV